MAFQAEMDRFWNEEILRSIRRHGNDGNGDDAESFRIFLGVELALDVYTTLSPFVVNRLNLRFCQLLEARTQISEMKKFICSK